MKLATNPGVWRVALLAVVAAAVQVGLLTPAIGDQLNGLVTGLAEVATVLLPIAGALWAKRHTAPVAAGTPAVRALVRGGDGVYRADLDPARRTETQKTGYTGSWPAPPPPT